MAFDYLKFLAENKLTATSKLNEKAKLLNENYIDLRPINSLRENKFYAPDYIKRKYGVTKAREIESNIHDAEEIENNPNLWDLFTSLETPAETDQFIQGYINDSLNEEEGDDDDDIEDVQSSEEEFDFMAPGKKDEFDTDDDMEPGAKDVKGGEEVAASGKQGKLMGLIKQKDAILSKLKSGQITIDQYKQEIGNIPLQIKNLQASIDQDLNVSDDTEEEI